MHIVEAIGAVAVLRKLGHIRPTMLHQGLQYSQAHGHQLWPVALESLSRAVHY
jgi:hypothetical protein